MYGKFNQGMSSLNLIVANQRINDFQAEMHRDRMAKEARGLRAFFSRKADQPESYSTQEKQIQPAQRVAQAH
ncbi:MAG TPA: hypothetical protein VH186_28560 [Chloroflexia bacterium]|nr:hypothetical protein [Chloroflexia bacterium]